MRIALDISGIFAEKVGINTYIEGLLGALAEADKTNEYFLYSSFFTDFKERVEGVVLPPGGNFRPLFRRFPQKLTNILEWKVGYRDQERFLLNHGIELVHGTGNIVPKTCRLKSVVTNHGYMDKAGLKRYWTVSGRNEEAYFDELVRCSLLDSDRIIAVSEWTKRGIVEKLEIQADKIDVVEIGVNECFRRGAGDARLAKEIGVSGPYIVLIGHNPKKRNIKRVLEAFSELLATTPTDHKIVIANGKQIEGTDYCAEMGQVWEKLKKSGRLILTGTLSLDEMSALYAGADLLAYPSLMEGFGIPIIEAMACGCPVVTSDVEPMAGIAGRAGMLVQPEDAQSILGALRSVLSDRDLRGELSARGILRAKEFSWKAAAEKTIAVYKKLGDAS